MAVIGSRTNGPVGLADHLAALARRWVLDGPDRALAVESCLKAKWDLVNVAPVSYQPTTTTGPCFFYSTLFFSLGFGVSFTATVQ